MFSGQGLQSVTVFWHRADADGCQQQQQHRSLLNTHPALRRKSNTPCSVLSGQWRGRTERLGLYGPQSLARSKVCVLSVLLTSVLMMTSSACPRLSVPVCSQPLPEQNHRTQTVCMNQTGPERSQQHQDPTTTHKNTKRNTI